MMDTIDIASTFAQLIFAVPSILMRKPNAAVYLETEEI